MLSSTLRFFLIFSIETTESTSSKMNLSGMIFIFYERAMACCLVLGNPSIIQLFCSFSIYSMLCLTISMTMSSFTQEQDFLDSTICFPNSDFLITSLFKSSPTEISSYFISSYENSARVKDNSFLLHPGGPTMISRFTIFKC